VQLGPQLPIVLGKCHEHSTQKSAVLVLRVGVELVLDKPMRDHMLLQSIARVNQPYIDAQGVVKRIGVVVDFVINCERGEVVRANSDEELLAAVKAHLSRDHPELLEKLSREDILGIAEEEE
jgi:hypothetical protein